ncbi:MAG: anhydro-N-acetylmuramic acid kinase [Gemmatimonadetes bacterium]|nr:anhydro-N-acetylmuramic acid kinase [Gemmatimonadota bacterium]|tara:strand:+ start:291 stop:1433 length:1143 start_codon:yes stop_codon:yes gene_type:complete
MLAIGLMSGTSADGVDAALVELDTEGDRVSFSLLGFLSEPYPDAVREAIIAVARPGGGTVDEICQLNVLVGHYFGQAARAVCDRAGKDLSNVRVIGSHGQTIHHLPEETDVHGRAVRSTLQIGDAATIAESTGIRVVSDFRSRDIAVGGQGAPLVPLVDYLLCRSDDVGRVMLNLGGISNLTGLAPGCARQDVFAFDTGPGNMIIDALVAQATDQSYDRDGALAAKGTVDPQVVDALLEDSYFLRSPPKSTGREFFGHTFLQKLHALTKEHPFEDRVATATSLTARSVGESVDRFVRPEFAPDEVYVSGGGRNNPVLMQWLQDALPDCDLQPTDMLGVDSNAKEALAFAILAVETLEGRPGNLPRVTGGSRSVVLGQITP